MIINKIKIKNWQTHIDSSFEFSKGINALLGVMGSGKSSVLDAISFALFGTFPAAQQRRIKLEDVITDLFTKSESAQVILEFEKDNKIYEITRKIERKKGTSFSELRCDGILIESPASQRVTEKIEIITNINYNTFSQIVYCEQNKLDQFLQIPRGQRMKKIDELLKIDRFEAARSNIMTLKNRIIKTSKDIEIHTDQLKELIKSKDIETLKSEIKNILIQIEVFTKRLNEIKQKKDALKKETEILQKKKQIYDTQKEKHLTIQTKIKHIEQELENYTNTVDVKSYTLEFINTQIERLNSALKRQKSVEKEITITDEKIKANTTTLDNENQILNLLESKRPEIKKLKDTEKNIEELRTLVSEQIKKEASINSKIEDEIKSINTLKESVANCPTCDTRLSDEKKEKVINQKQDKINEFEKSLITLTKGINTTTNDIETQEKEKINLLKYVNLEQDISEKKETIKQIKSDQEQLKKTQNESTAKFNPEKIKQIEQEIRRFETTKTILRHIQEQKSFKEDEKQIKINLEELKFEPKTFEQKTTEFIAVDKLYSTDIITLKSKKELYLEKTKNLEMIEKQIELIQHNEKQIENIKDKIPGLERFKIVLENTQIMLREQFIESINNIMDELFNATYPYNDYIGIRISVDEGDYILQLQNMENQWINVEGTVSGGERMTAVLVLRIAMSTVLAPGIKLLLLDEPTHNLDKKAVTELADTLRTKVQNIVKQVFLITHDEAMETAVTGKLYRLNRGDKKEDMTEVIEV